MVDLIVAGILLSIVGIAVTYIIKAKKSGVKCIGCPAAGKCGRNNGHSECSCGCHTDTLTGSKNTSENS